MIPIDTPMNTPCWIEAYDGVKKGKVMHVLASYVVVLTPEGEQYSIRQEYVYLAEQEAWEGYIHFQEVKVRMFKEYIERGRIRLAELQTAG